MKREKRDGKCATRDRIEAGTTGGEPCVDRETLEMDSTDEWSLVSFDVRFSQLLVLSLSQLRDGSAMGGSAKRRQSGVPAPRTEGGRR